jgi:hypothetical protein
MLVHGVVGRTGERCCILRLFREEVVRGLAVEVAWSDIAARFWVDLGLY